MASAPTTARDHLERDVRPVAPQQFPRRCERVESGSKRAGSGGMIVRVRLSRITTPLLVLDGEKDAALTRDEVCATATAYGTQAAFFPNMGHNMMLEPAWRDVAERICEWLAIKNL